MRIEHDTMGTVEVPDNAYYGAQTQRAINNFPISGKALPPEFSRALGLVKWACARANDELGLLSSGCSPLDKEQIEALLSACLETAEGKFDDQFPVDVFQTGSGTSTNMNANEVIARRANEIISQKSNNHQAANSIHPNDHVNLGQSTNDIFPSALHVALFILIQERFLPAVKQAVHVLKEKSEQWNEILKIGRTHLADATPMTLGQEINGLADQLITAQFAGSYALLRISELPVGGTAVGTGINTDKAFGSLVCRHLNTLIEHSGNGFYESANHFSTNAQRDRLVAAHSSMKSAAVTIMNVANNIRWLSSGPRAGFYEVIIPELQPGSSIMPGKVNPVMCEAVMQACAKVIGNDAAITTCGMVGGQFQLNIMMPLMADAAIESINILSSALEVFTEKCLCGLEANEERCRKGVEKSLSMATALNPHIGYEKAAEVAKEAFKTGKTVRDVCLEWNVLPKDILNEVLDPMRMTQPISEP